MKYTWHILNVCGLPGIIIVMAQCGLLERELDTVSSSALTSVGSVIQGFFVLRRVLGRGHLLQPSQDSDGNPQQKTIHFKRQQISLGET